MYHCLPPRCICHQREKSKDSGSGCVYGMWRLRSELSKQRHLCSCRRGLCFQVHLRAKARTRYAIFLQDMGLRGVRSASERGKRSRLFRRLPIIKQIPFKLSDKLLEGGENLMAERLCKLTGKKLNFPKDCKGCKYLKPRGKRNCCTYKGAAKKICFK